ncbi:hypothetical protein F4677DRAFT_304878 [Hypoxylon crocopeplum]|nr:hypothetical protein F4677DRAFT_304878 [Hypoxylon crocopeplum]
MADSPSVSALAVIAEREPQSLQLHADKVIHLEFFAEDSVHHKLFRNLRFPNLESLELDASDDNDDAALEPYLQPQLNCLLFYGGPISDAFLEKLQSSCPQLEELLIDNPRDLISPEGFLRFLESAKALKQLTLLYGVDRVVTDSVFIALAIRPGLEVFRLQKLVTASLVSKAVEEQTRRGASERLFPQLLELTCVAELDGLAALLPHLSQLTYLDTGLRRGRTETHSSVPDISTHCPDLRVLLLEYAPTEDARIPPQTLVKLAEGLHELEQLGISGEKVEVEGFGLAQFASMVHALPCLKSLRLAFECQLTEAALVETSKSCGTTLTELEIGGSYDLRKLEGLVLFPRLRSLGLGKLVSTATDMMVTKEEAVRTARLLKRIAPDLEDFNVISEDLFDDMVEKSWKELVNPMDTGQT